MNAMVRTPQDAMAPAPAAPPPAAGALCPHCGAPLSVRGIATNATTGEVTFAGRTVHLPPRGLQLLRALRQANRDAIHPDTLQRALGVSAPVSLRRLISTTRQQIAPLGLRIVNFRNGGYRLDGEAQ